MKLNNLQALKTQQEALKKELSGMESVVSFRNPIKSIQFFSQDLFKRNKGNKEEKQEDKEKKQLSPTVQPVAKPLLAYAKTHLEQSELLDELFQNGIHKVALFILNKYLNKKVKTSWKKKIISSLFIFLLPILIKYLYEALKNKKKHEF